MFLSICKTHLDSTNICICFYSYLHLYLSHIFCSSSNVWSINFCSLHHGGRAPRVPTAKQQPPPCGEGFVIVIINLIINLIIITIITAFIYIIISITTPILVKFDITLSSLSDVYKHININTSTSSFFLLNFISYSKN